MKIPIDRLAWFLVNSDDPCQRELVRETLSNLCRTLSASAAMVHLFDDASVVLDVEVSIRNEAHLKIAFAPRANAWGDCAIQGSPIAEEGVCGGSVCASGRCLEADGLRSRACVPLRLGSTTIGSLSVLVESPREVSAADIEHMTVKGKQLVLRMHHTFYFPELCAEWMDLEQSWGHRGANGGTKPEPMTDRLRLRPGSMSYRVLAHEGCNHISSVAALTRCLPKGIHWPTLHRICEYLDHSRPPISRRDLSSAIGVSDVTAGHYLKYLVDAGLVTRELAYGGVGRPAIMYRLLNGPTVS